MKKWLTDQTSEKLVKALTKADLLSLSKWLTDENKPKWLNDQISQNG